ncbi:hypothetical protein VFPPC_03450 [Pochonia chlamydosporia 170]|uniref:Uncharacterized protein n=1 Tax=Pochonia chlamydosporia 170 TaxID=1380566 RepID=A0A179FZJ6_METCM|nr:hypothetical protein VFPPC_03450 [Pochonia chlamydosporia 170]OAQ71095.2 hypothetical protein VFPPC_03450 [Pochonia chlamydosporia 170]
MVISRMTLVHIAKGGRLATLLPHKWTRRCFCNSWIHAGKLSIVMLVYSVLQHWMCSTMCAMLIAVLSVLEQEQAQDLLFEASGDEIDQQYGVWAVVLNEPCIASVQLAANSPYHIQV